MIERLKGVLAVVIVCSVFAVLAGYIEYRFQDVPVPASGQPVTVILDPGHGIPDGGAVAADGTTEQELNLDIANCVADCLQEKGIAVLQTRSTEDSIFSEGNSIHAKKVSDIRNRVKICKENPGAEIISIHMNSYPDPSVYGIQVFYRGGDESAKLLAETIQTSFNTTLQPDHIKTPKTIPAGIYLFAHTENPAVLIECGFLSNQNELDKLKTPEYRRKIAKIIADAVSG